jgi:hypothetical protein
MKQPPQIKDIATASGVKPQTVYNTIANDSHSRQMPEILCASCALYNERRTTGKDLLAEMHEQGQLSDQLVKAFSHQFKTSFAWAKDLLGILNDTQKRHTIEVCEISETKRLGVHASFMIQGLSFQLSEGDLCSTLHFGGNTFNGSIDELINILSCLFKGKNN